MNTRPRWSGKVPPKLRTPQICWQRHFLRNTKMSLCMQDGNAVRLLEFTTRIAELKSNSTAAECRGYNKFSSELLLFKNPIAGTGILPFDFNPNKFSDFKRSVICWITATRPEKYRLSEICAVPMPLIQQAWDELNCYLSDNWAEVGAEVWPSV